MPKIIEFHMFQIDLCAEELHNSVLASIAIQSDLLTATELLASEFEKNKWQCGVQNAWWNQLHQSIEKNESAVSVSCLLIVCIT